MLDAIQLEKMGIPAACVGVELLINSTGRGMARALGFPDYRMVVIQHAGGALPTIKDDEVVRALAQSAAEQIEKVLVAGSRAEQQ